MKSLLFILLVSVFSFNLKGALYVEKSDKLIDKRSVSFFPSMEVDQGLLTIHFITPLQNLHIQIYNECRVLIYEDTISGVFGENYFISLDDSEHHSYMIQLSHIKLGVQNYMITF